MQFSKWYISIGYIFNLKLNCYLMLRGNDYE